MLTIDSQTKAAAKALTCRHCGKHGVVGTDFVERKLPSAQLCIDGKKQYYRVLLPDGTEQKFANEPHPEEILALFEKAEKKAPAKADDEKSDAAKGKAGK